MLVDILNPIISRRNFLKWGGLIGFALVTGCAPTRATSTPENNTPITLSEIQLTALIDTMRGWDLNEDMIAVVDDLALATANSEYKAELLGSHALRTPVAVNYWETDNPELKDGFSAIGWTVKQSPNPIMYPSISGREDLTIYPPISIDVQIVLDDDLPRDFGPEATAFALLKEACHISRIGTAHHEELAMRIGAVFTGQELPESDRKMVFQGYLNLQSFNAATDVQGFMMVLATFYKNLSIPGFKSAVDKGFLRFFDDSTLEAVIPILQSMNKITISNGELAWVDVQNYMYDPQIIDFLGQKIFGVNIGVSDVLGNN